ncbi:MAG: ribonuclease catalytic domain-containing protein [Desulfovibrionaceae bacterium]|nr:ribonuclease catalytic domain-containing protein [Desulfovibrionaceae bacterium]
MEFLQDNQPVTAWVLDVQGARLRVFTSGQRELKLPLSRALPWTGPQCSAGASRQEMLDLLRTHHGRRERLAEAVDALELWDLAQGELDEAEIDWFASLVFDTPNPDQLAALGRKLLQTKTHFKFSPPKFEIYPRETVERRQEEMRKAQERERLVGFGQVFLRGLWDAFTKRKATPPQPDAEQTQRIHDLLMTRIANPDDRDSEALWKTMSQGLPEDPFLPLYLAQAWGIVPPHFNFHLARAQYDWTPDWAGEHAQAVEDIARRVLAGRTAPVTSIVTIDSASTQDIDDGFSLERTASGFTLRQALACPPLGWEFGSSLDRAVLHRFTSLYLPEGTSHMLPEALGTAFFSLNAGQERPALVITFDLDENGALRSFEPAIAWIHVDANLTYAGVEADIAAGTTAMLGSARDLAALLRAQRIHDHAVIMDQPDPRLVLSGDPANPTVEVRQSVSTPEAQMIVSEFMILANKAMAAWALDNDVPLLFRTQNITLPAESAGVWSEPTDIYRIINNMGPSILECEPKRHATIGAKAYAPVTSPLRRYSDFLNMAQILAKLTGQGRLLTKDELERLLPILSSRAEMTGQVQRMRPRYWKCEYFRQNHKKTRWSGIIVDAGPVLVTISLPDMQLFLKAPRKIFGDKIRLGQRFAIRIGKVDPLNNEIKIVEAWEEE